MNRQTIKYRTCGWCNTTIRTDADGLIAHSMKEHDKASPPRKERVGSIFSGWNNIDSIGFLSNLIARGRL